MPSRRRDAAKVHALIRGDLPGLRFSGQRLAWQMVREQLPSAFQRTVLWTFSRPRPGIFVNRPVRTRMPGGMGAGGIKPPGYPIKSFYCDASTDCSMALLYKDLISNVFLSDSLTSTRFPTFSSTGTHQHIASPSICMLLVTIHFSVFGMSASITNAIDLL